MKSAGTQSNYTIYYSIYSFSSCCYIYLIYIYICHYIFSHFFLKVIDYKTLKYETYVLQTLVHMTSMYTYNQIPCLYINNDNDKNFFFRFHVNLSFFFLRSKLCTLFKWCRSIASVLLSLLIHFLSIEVRRIWSLRNPFYMHSQYIYWCLNERKRREKFVLIRICRFFFFVVCFDIE